MQSIDSDFFGNLDNRAFFYSMAPAPSTEEHHNLPRIYGKFENSWNSLNYTNDVPIRKASLKTVTAGDLFSFRDQFTL